MTKVNVKTIKWLFSQIADELKQTSEVLTEDNIDILVNFLPEENEVDMYYVIKEAIILSTLSKEKRKDRIDNIVDLSSMHVIEASLETSTVLANQCKVSDKTEQSKNELLNSRILRQKQLESELAKVNEDILNIRKTKESTKDDLEDKYMASALTKANNLAKENKIETDKSVLAEPKLKFVDPIFDPQQFEGYNDFDFNNAKKVEFLTLDEVKEKYPEKFKKPESTISQEEGDRLIGTNPTDKEKQILLKEYLKMILLSSLAYKLDENVDNPIN